MKIGSTVTVSKRLDATMNLEEGDTSFNKLTIKDIEDTEVLVHSFYNYKENTLVNGVYIIESK